MHKTILRIIKKDGREIKESVSHRKLREVEDNRGQTYKNKSP